LYITGIAIFGNITIKRIKEFEKEQEKESEFAREFEEKIRRKILDK
jgi:hypothetical protein